MLSLVEKQMKYYTVFRWEIASV